ncbi:MAG: hypothetical protein ACOC0P_04195 [Planctomycetota bacterium]
MSTTPQGYVSRERQHQQYRQTKDALRLTFIRPDARFGWNMQVVPCFPTR